MVADMLVMIRQRLVSGAKARILLQSALHPTDAQVVLASAEE